MSNKKIIITILFILLAVNPLELYYNSSVPSIQKQKIYFDSEFSSLNINEYEEKEREIFRNKKYIIVLKNKENIKVERSIEKIKKRFEENKWTLLNENNNIRENKEETKIILFAKNEYRAETEFFKKYIVVRFWHKNYYE